MLFKERGIRIVAASADDRDHARQVAEGMGLPFPLGWGLEAEAVHRLTGAVISRERGIVQPAAFILRPDCRLAASVISSWAVGRLRPEEVFGAIHYLGKVQS